MFLTYLPTVCLSVCYQTCVHDIFKTNEPILQQLAQVVHGARR